MRRLSVLALSAALALPGVAHAADAPCLTPGEFTAVSTYALPSVIRGTANHCSAALPTGAFLRTDGEKLARRYEAGREKAWPQAKAAMLRVGLAMSPEAAKIFGQMSDDALKPMLDELVVGAIGQQLPTDRCKPVDRALMLLSPLPAENTAEMIGLIAGLTARSGKAKLGKFSLCTA